MWRALIEAILDSSSIQIDPGKRDNKRRSRWAEYLLISGLLLLVLVINLAPALYSIENKGLLLALLTLSSLLLSSITLILLVLIKVIRSIYPQNFLLLYLSLAIIYSMLLSLLNLKFEIIL